MSKILFVIGSPRSGTTFLSTLLKMTPYGSPYETHFIPKVYDKIDIYGDLNKFSNFNKLLRDILKERSIMQFIGTLDVKDTFRSLSPNITLSKVIDSVCLKGTNCVGGKAWGDKTPWYITRIEVLVKLFPDAKFIYLYRDGRDVALSLLEKKWGPNNIYSCAKLWSNQNQLPADIISKIEDNNQFIACKYESLLAQPQLEVMKVYNFLNCTITEADLNEICSITKTSNSNKWKVRLSQKQIEIFDSIANNELKNLGYETSTSPRTLSGYSKAFYFIEDYFFWFIYMVRLNVIDGIKIKYFGKKPFDE